MTTETASSTALDDADKERLLRKYAEERDKRLRPDGLNQYVRLFEVLPEESGDPFTPVTPREPLTDHVTFTFVGGGFAGLLTGARLKEAGVDDVRIVDAAGGFGGVWYWNRYPGIMCDTSSLVYLPLLEETGYMPTEKYAHGPEILEHCERIGKHFGLYDQALFHTQIEGVTWDEGRSCWLIRTNRGDAFTSQYLGIGTGPLHVAKLPDLPGIETFQGKEFHTSRWDYGYTGGDPNDAPLTGLADKRVAVVGTGATAIQVVPALARDTKQLLVFQRTPSSVDVRDNGPIDPEWFRQISAEPGWQQRWLENFTTNWEGFLGQPPPGVEVEDLVQDGWTELGRRVRTALHSIPPEEFSLEAMMQAASDVDLVKMERIRARVDEVVEDPQTREGLKAWYSQMCKRPAFHDEYLQTFNRPNTTLIHTDGKGVERVTAKGVVANGTEYEVDCIIWASGFEYGTDFVSRAGFDPVGRNGITLSEHWTDGMRTLHGMHVHGFPNLFTMQLPQGAFLGSNVPHNFVEAARTIAAIVSHAQRTGAGTVEVDADAEEQWVNLLLEHGMPMANAECTPGYYNNEGGALGRRERLLVGYPPGAGAFFTMIDAWRSDGRFEGLTFR